jgi:hypothetical protein
LPTPVEKPDKSKKSRSPSPPRRKNRFNERELARAGRAAKAIGAERIEVDPATGKISVILPTGKRAVGNDLDQWIRDRNARATDGNS